MNKDEDGEDETHQNSISSFDLRAFLTYNFFYFYFSVCDDEMSLRNPHIIILVFDYCLLFTIPQE